MKKTFGLFFVAFATMFMSVSCLNLAQWEQKENDDAKIVTIVDGSYNTPYYVEFDTGETAYVTSNSAGSSITFPAEPAQMKGEVRKLIFFYYDGEKEGYDKSIAINSMQDVSTELIKLTTDDSIKNVLKEHDDQIAINGVAYAKNRKYVTLELLIYQSLEISYKHSVIIAYNPTREGAYKEIYENIKGTDNYLWLEIYHDNAGDTTTNNVEKIYTSIKLDEETMGISNISNYQGIKFIHKNFDTNIATIFTYDFNS